MAEEEVVLLDFWPSPFGMRVRLALAAKGIKYEYKEQDLLNKSPLLLKMNPVHKKIPVLIHNGKPVCESLVVIQYIDEVWKDKSPLLPSDPYQRAQVLFWVDYVDKQVFVIGKKVWRSTGEAQQANKKEFMECLKPLEVELGEKPYFGGDTLGFVDVTLIPYCYNSFPAFEIGGNFSIEVECPMLVAWVKRCTEKESVSKCLPNPQELYDFALQRKKFLGIE